MDYQIRNAELKDIEEIIKLCAEHAEFDKAEFSANGKAKKLADFLFSDHPPVSCLIVEKDIELLGYTTLMPEFSTWDADYYVYMDCLFLHPHAHNSFIGGKLIKV